MAAENIKRSSANRVWVSIVGTRPQLIKLGPLCRAIEAYNARGDSPQIDHRIIHTGQHYDYELAALLFAQMRIPAPNHDIGAGSGSHATQLARMMVRLEPLLLSEAPDWVINYGDTNSTLAGTLVGARLNLPLAHVEAGCRSGDLSMPEEQTRIIADQLSCLLLAPSATAEKNLHREAIGAKDDRTGRRVAVVGDLLYDALLQNLPLADSLADQVLRELGIRDRNYYLLTLHRAENTNHADRLQAIVGALESLDLPVVFPVHPRTRKVLVAAGISLNGPICMTPPLGYLEMLAVEKHARKILTDSGGIQKEAFYLRVPCVTLRESTEWPETVELGGNRITGSCVERIHEAVLADGEEVPKFAAPYGDGTTACRIVRELQDFGIQ